VALVYAITHIASGREYVGLTARTLRKRWKEHKIDADCRAKTYFHRALAKYGRDAFTTQVLANLPIIAEAKIAERIAIAVRKPAFNLTAGGDGTPGRKLSAEAKARISTANSRPKSPATREKMRIAAHNKLAPSAETRAKLSAAAKAQWAGPVEGRPNITARGKSKRVRPGRSVYRPKNQIDWSK
jgi:group I intron endonuclease